VVTYSRRGLHGIVLESLGPKIVSGELAPGTVLDMERLELELSVSRTSLREAFRVLSAKGLVDARPRHGTFVMPRTAWNVLDSDVIRWSAAGRVSQDTLAALNEVRQIFEPSVARLAAERRQADDLDAMQDALARLSGSVTGQRQRVDSYVSADVAFHQALLAAAHNELLSQLAPVLEHSLRLRDTLVAHHHSPDDDDFMTAHQGVLDAVREHDGELAEQRMRALLASAAADVERVLAARPAQT